MFHQKVDERTELRLLGAENAPELFRVLEGNRDHLRAWHPWVDLMRSAGEVEKAIALWLRQNEAKRGFYAGIWFDGELCGVVNHLNVDWANRSVFLSYWLDAAHQGKGIVTACVRALVAHAFETWKLNRVTIECATENARSRRIPERLGFKLEGITRSSEWLHDRFVDHAIYGLLRGEYEGGKGTGQSI